MGRNGDHHHVRNLRPGCGQRLKRSFSIFTPYLRESLKRVTSKLMLSPFNTLQINPFLYHLPQWTQFSQEVNFALDSFNHEINFILRRESSNSKSD